MSASSSSSPSSPPPSVLPHRSVIGVGSLPMSTSDPAILIPVVSAIRSRHDLASTARNASSSSTSSAWESAHIIRNIDTILADDDGREEQLQAFRDLHQPHHQQYHQPLVPRRQPSLPPTHTMPLRDTYPPPASPPRMHRASWAAQSTTLDFDDEDALALPPPLARIASARSTTAETDLRRHTVSSVLSNATGISSAPSLTSALSPSSSPPLLPMGLQYGQMLSSPYGSLSAPPRTASVSKPSLPFSAAGDRSSYFLGSQPQPLTARSSPSSGRFDRPFSADYSTQASMWAEPQRRSRPMSMVVAKASTEPSPPPQSRARPLSSSTLDLFDFSNVSNQFGFPPVPERPSTALLEQMTTLDLRGVDNLDDEAVLWNVVPRLAPDVRPPVRHLLLSGVSDVLRSGKIGDAGVTAIASRLRPSGPSPAAILVTLDLSDNRMGQSGILQLVNALLVCRTLRRLSVRANRVGTSGALLLALAIEENTTLTSLDVSWNDIGPAGSIALTDAIHKRPTPLDIAAFGNGLDEPALTALATTTASAGFGRPVPPDLLDLARAAELGNTEAQVALAEYYEEGSHDALPMDLPEAARWYYRAASSGGAPPAATSTLGPFPTIFHGTPAPTAPTSPMSSTPLSPVFSPTSSSNWPAHITPSSIPGSPVTSTGNVDAAGAGGAPATVVARRTAQRRLALMALEARGVPRDPGLAAAFFSLAARLHDPTAQLRLADMYDRGAHLPRDVHLAEAYYRSAAMAGVPT
ncbi:hypothetical protein HK405_012651, partial [Cladochytrium tenue]